MLDRPLIDPVPKPSADVPRPLPQSSTLIRRRPQGVLGLTAFTLLLASCFASPLSDLARYAAHSDLYSHILLIPFISLYLVWLKRRNLALQSEPVRGLAAFPLFLAAAALIGYWEALRSGWKPSSNDYLALMTLAFLGSFITGCLLFLGRLTMRAIAFPIAFLVFMVPFPSFLLVWIETLLQHGSAYAAAAFFKVSGMPLFRQGLEFQLPGFSMHVAPECSGIHSTLVLFITSLLAAHLLLSNRWSRVVLVLAVIPLALLRNGFRIFVVGQLCVRISPDMINSYIHRRGGPIFFALSLIPFFLLLLFLRKRDTRSRRGNEADRTL